MVVVKVFLMLLGILFLIDRIGGLLKEVVKEKLKRFKK